jgi:RNA polymerase sigma factor (sigma-70 family)
VSRVITTPNRELSISWSEREGNDAFGSAFKCHDVLRALQIQSESRKPRPQYRRDRSGLRREVPIEEVDRQSPLMASSPTPDQILENQQRLDCLTALLDTVNPRTREIYFAHRSGYTYAEIADDMGIAEITIRRHIARARY